MSDESSHGDEQALVARAATDFDAFAELYRFYLPRVHEYAFRRTGNTEAAEDICSATFEAALGTIDRFRWRSGGFAPWLFRIASRQTIAHYRREARPKSERGQRAMAQLAPAETLGADSTVGTDDEVLRLALNQLNDRHQQAITLRYLAHLDTSEAARAMGITKSAFSVILTRASKALRRELDRLEGGETR